MEARLDIRVVGHRHQKGENHADEFRGVARDTPFGGPQAERTHRRTAVARAIRRNGGCRDAADRALTLSPDLAAAHLARGYLLQRADFDWRGAEAEFRRAMELAPNDSDAKYNLGNLLAVYGELEPAIDLTRQAIATEPLYYYPG